MRYLRYQCFPTFVGISLFLYSQLVAAILFEPGVGVGLQYTDNARLSNENKVDDIITSGYIGARLSESEGSLIYDAAASFTNTGYTQDTFPDRRYFNLRGSLNWEMVKERLDWFLSNSFSQRTINSLDPNTPDNLQDTNVFNTGLNMVLYSSARQGLTFVPQFSQFYYENQNTNNKQYSLAANWNYQAFRLTGIGLNMSTRYIDYFEQELVNVRFTNAAFVISGTRKRYDFALNAGATNVKRDTGEDDTGFSGSANFVATLSSRSSFSALASSRLTDTSTTAASNAGIIPGSENNIQITTDVIRDSNASVSYMREDYLLRSSLTARYQKVEYSDNPLDRVIRSVGGQINYPMTRLLIGGLYINYNQIDQLDTGRIDERIRVGGNLIHSFSRKLRGTLNLAYRTNNSTTLSSNYDEYSLFASLVYGFGSVPRR